jgi:hypothetical protein
MTPRRLDLALQGGGSHGAFTWGARRGGTGSAYASEQHLDLGRQQGQLLLDDAPRDAVVDEVITVDQHVAKRDDLPMLSDAGRHVGASLAMRFTASPMISKLRSLA